MMKEIYDKIYDIIADVEICVDVDNRINDKGFKTLYIKESIEELFNSFSKVFEDTEEILEMIRDYLYTSYLYAFVKRNKWNSINLEDYLSQYK